MDERFPDKEHLIDLETLAEAAFGVLCESNQQINNDNIQIKADINLYPSLRHISQIAPSKGLTSDVWTADWLRHIERGLQETQNALNYLEENKEHIEFRLIIFPCFSLPNPSNFEKYKGNRQNNIGQLFKILEFHHKDS